MEAKAPWLPSVPPTGKYRLDEENYFSSGELFSKERIGWPFVLLRVTPLLTTHVGLNQILFRNPALLQYFFCEVTIAF
jgi:hypothetical protein